MIGKLISSASNFILFGANGEDHVAIEYKKEYNFMDVRLFLNNTDTSTKTTLQLTPSVNNYFPSANQTGRIQVGYISDTQNYYVRLYLDNEIVFQNSLQSPYKIYSNTYIVLGQYSAGFMTGSYMKGIIDLKDFYVTVNGNQIFNGNITGIDTYTINSQTVSIPYTLCKTGSKIVESSYRTQVAEVYSQEGNTPYYTLSDTDYTLPQGELYGMIQNAYQNGFLDDANGITMGFPLTPTTTPSTFTAPSAGWAYIYGDRQSSGGSLITYKNGHIVAHWAAYSSFGSSVLIPVSKGDVISVSVDTNSSWNIGEQYFYPAKGV